MGKFSLCIEPIHLFSQQHVHSEQWAPGEWFVGLGEHRVMHTCDLRVPNLALIFLCFSCFVTVSLHRHYQINA